MPLCNPALLPKPDPLLVAREETKGTCRESALCYGSNGRVEVSDAELRCTLPFCESKHSSEARREYLVERLEKD